MCKSGSILLLFHLRICCTVWAIKGSLVRPNNSLCVLLITECLSLLLFCFQSKIGLHFLIINCEYFCIVIFKTISFSTLSKALTQNHGMSNGVSKLKFLLFSAINFMLNNESMQDLSSRYEKHTSKYTYQVL